MNTAQAHAAISSTFAAGWGSTTPIIWDNTVPDTPGRAWVRFSVQHGGTKAQPWSGSTVNRYVNGIATATIYTRMGTGTVLVDQLAEQAKTILRDRDLPGGIDLYHDGVVEDGPNGHGWWVVKVKAVFVYQM